MIIRFKLEAVGKTRDDVTTELANATDEIFKFEETDIDNWVCTQDVVANTISGSGYRGRIIWKRRDV